MRVTRRDLVILVIAFVSLSGAASAKYFRNGGAPPLLGGHVLSTGSGTNCLSTGTPSFCLSMGS
jgi:hypothetical protein